MRMLEGSLIYRLIIALSQYYRYSILKRIFSAVAETYRHSALAKGFRALAERESSMQYSIFVQIVKKLFRIIDRWMLRFSNALSKWSETSLLVRGTRGIMKMAREKRIALILPLFGFGFLVGRIVLNRLMIRDVCFLGLTFICAAVWMMDREKIKTVWKNSLVYRIYRLVLE